MRHPLFRAVWIASLASNFGGLIQSVGAAWLMASIAPSAEMVALVQTSTTLPIMFFSLAAGAIADNYDRRSIMLVAQVFMLVVSLLLTIITGLSSLTPWMLLVFTFLIGCGSALNGPAWQASVGEMVPREDLPAAVALNSMGFNVARSVGPAIGGFIVAAAGAAVAFAVNAATYVGLILVLLRWKPPRPDRALPPESLTLAMGAGLRYAAMSPSIKRVISRCFLFGFGAAAVQGLMPLIARDLVVGGPVTYGLLLGSFGAGAVSGALLSARLRTAFSVETLARLSFAGLIACVTITAFSHASWLTMAAMVFGGASWVVAMSNFNVSIQLSAPRWVMARTLSLYQTAAFGGMAIGSWTWGWIAERSGVAEALLLSIVVHVLGILVGLRFRLHDLTDASLDPLRRWSVPNVAFDVQPQSGPIVITIEYRISAADVPEFLAIMAERRRVRRRDGARHWSLLRDLGDTELWIERYHTPTWVDYIRHNQRITLADAMIGERLRALHRGGDIVVHRMIERQTGSLRDVSARATDPSSGEAMH
ncbi:MAG: transporter permease [Hyphomicrobiales bacterium]|nr:transporter permease [Hyphomicrobiales bacterium]